MNGKPIRIMWSHRDPAFRKSGVGNIFIKVRSRLQHITQHLFVQGMHCLYAVREDRESCILPHVVKCCQQDLC